MTVAGNARSESDVEISGMTVTLTLASAVTYGQAVTLSYTPGANKLQDTDEAEAAELTDESVTNNTLPVISIAPASAPEGDNIVFTVTLSPASADTVTLDYAAADGTAIKGTDFTLADGSLTFMPGDTEKTITVSTTEDSLDEGSESFPVTLTGLTNAVFAGGRPRLAGGGTILDDDPLVAVEVLSTWGLVPSDVSAGDSFRLLFVSTTTRHGRTAVVGPYDTHVRTAAASGHTDIQEHSAHFRALVSAEAVDARIHTGTTFTDGDKGIPIYWLGGAKVADDYEGFFDGAWDSNAPRDESGTLTATTVEVFTGSADDGTKVANRYVGSTSAETRVGTPGTSGEELDSGDDRSTDDEIAYYGLSGIFTIPIVATPALTDTTVDGSTLTLTYGTTLDATSEPATTDFTVTVGGNARSVSDVSISGMTVTLTLASPVTYGQQVTLSYTPGTNRIKDTDATEAAALMDHSVTNNTLPVLSITYGAASEGDAVVFTVTLSPASSETVTVDYSADDGTAIKGTDFTLADGSLTFMPGDTEKTITVPTTEDTLDEGSETFPIALTAPTNATLQGGRPRLLAPGTILDDDDSVAVDVSTSWALLPTGLEVGDSFRLIFVSSTTRNAKTGAIGPYDTVVRSAAAAGHPDIQAHSAHFRALGSTEAVDARVHTATEHTTTEPGVPIYWLGGEQVADDYSDFYDGTWASNEPTSESGTATATGVEVFTGTSGDGTKVANLFLGRSENDVRVGKPGTSGEELDSGSNQASDQTLAFYGLSGVFNVVATPVEEVPHDWGLIPSGLGPGDSFRLLFVTSDTRNGRLTTIETYDEHVQEAAAAGHSAIQTYSEHFKALASTETVDARDHTSSTESPGVPIYWLDGAKVADNYSDFYDGDWDSNEPRNESGTEESSTNLPFTGSNSDGTKFPDQFLGTTVGEVGAKLVRIGNPSTAQAELNSGAGRDKLEQGSFYGLSGLFVITADPNQMNRVTLALDPVSVQEDSNTTEVTVTATLAEPAPTDTELELQVYDGTAVSPEDYEAEPRALFVRIPAGATSGTGTVRLTPVHEPDGEPECAETVILRGARSSGGRSLPDVVPAVLSISDPGSDVLRCMAPVAQSVISLEPDSPRDPPRASQTGPRDAQGPPMEPIEAKVSIWTDRTGYVRGQSTRLYRTLHPRRDDSPYTFFYYLENTLSGRQFYFSPGIATTALEDVVVDHLGLSAGSYRASPIERMRQELIWAGATPRSGSWRFVAEIRSPDGMQRVKAGYANVPVSNEQPRDVGANGQATVIETDETWTRDTIYRLLQPVRVRAGATLTIQAGTLIQGLGTSVSIVVERGGRIEALGTRARPVVMTCDAPVGRREPGCWGGLVMLGNAPASDAYGPSTEASSEAGLEYGGDDPNDSSGTLRFVRVEFAGGDSDAVAVAFRGVGSGTEINYVQAHESAGDGIEFRGGTANCRYCVSSGARDDALEWSEGWLGTAQHVFLVQGLEGDNGIEATGPEAVLGTPGYPALYNLTVVGGAALGPEASSGNGFQLGAGAEVTARNVVVTGFGGFALGAASEAAGLFTNERSSIRNAILYDNGGQFGLAQVEEGISPYVEFVDADPQLRNLRYEANPDPRPRSASVALETDAAAVPPPDGTQWNDGPYLGAFGETNWLEPWTFLGPEPEFRVAAPGGNGQ